MIGIGYRGRRVLAAFRPIAAGNVGLVAKMDVATIDASYVDAAVAAGLVALVVVAGGVLLIVGVNRPVLAQLRESEARYRMLFDHIGVGAAVYEVVDEAADFRMRDLNCSARMSERLSRADVIGRSLFDVYPNVSATPLLEGLVDAWRTGQPQTVPTYYYQDARIEGWREAFVYRLPTGELVAIFFDVGERIRTEARLSESERRYRDLVERQPDLICQFLADTTLTFVNDAYTRYFGRSRNELIGARWIDLIPSTDRARCLADVAAITPTSRT